MKTTSKFRLLGPILFLSLTIYAQSEKSEIAQIEETLMHYIEGTANGEPERLHIAFHPDFNLYSVTEAETLRIWEGRDYISGVKVGQKNSRQGRIIFIDYEQDAATAKVEILVPGWRVFTDFFLLLKYNGSWKIVHKSYTSKAISNK